MPGKHGANWAMSGTVASPAPTALAAVGSLRPGRSRQEQAAGSARAVAAILAVPPPAITILRTGA